MLSNSTDAKDLVDILMTLAEVCTTDLQAQQFAFTRIEEILGLGDADDSEGCGTQHAHLFLKNGLVNDVPFLKALEARESSHDSYLEKSASNGLATLYSVCAGKPSHLIRWISSKLTSPSQGVWEIALPALAVLSRKQAARHTIIAKGCLSHVVDILKRLGVNGNAQQLYELTFVLWTLSLGQVADLKAEKEKEKEREADVKSFLSTGSVNVLVDLVAAAPSRKVTRVAVAALVNLAAKEDADMLTEMFTTPLQKLVTSMIQSNSYKLANDPEFEVDVKNLDSVLVKNYRELSTFERWSAEISSGNLRWGIVHTEKFWRENYKLVEANEYSALKALIKCLHSSDPVVVCIALYDLGEFARFYPNGRLVISAFNGKDLAMKLIGSTDTEVARCALQCTSKIMVQGWDLNRM